jgi:hypothetical protein
MLVACLRSDDGRSSNQTLIHLLVCIAVAIVEAARETAHDLEVWALLGSINHFPTLRAHS